ncbi:hypothetical protein ACQKO5_21475, partial [Novosphingobium subterraneum]|uniref:hypothetical protein n=1 Tax=Novosphingobium subterraneum TaxID=48936 RepID=UPI003CFF6294
PGSCSHPNPTRRPTVATQSGKPSYTTPRDTTFARNLLDKRFHASVIGLPFADAGGAVNWLTREGRRTLGASLEAKF